MSCSPCEHPKILTPLSAPAHLPFPSPTLQMQHVPEHTGSPAGDCGRVRAAARSAAACCGAGVPGTATSPPYFPKYPIPANFGPSVWHSHWTDGHRRQLRYEGSSSMLITLPFPSASRQGRGRLAQNPWQPSRQPRSPLLAPSPPRRAFVCRWHIPQTFTFCSPPGFQREQLSSSLPPPQQHQLRTENAVFPLLKKTYLEDAPLFFFPGHRHYKTHWRCTQMLAGTKQQAGTGEQELMHT